jgi:uncharacterized membrane protein YqaE (UPF0057 family)
MPFTASDLCKIVLAIFLPPLGVFLERGCNADFFINILLTILGYIPVRLPIHITPTHKPFTNVPARVSSTRCTSSSNFSRRTLRSLAENAPCFRPDLTFDDLREKVVGRRQADMI